ncbi:cytochrome P450 CYP125 [Phenylobacterium zucineum HLK1]|uniref:Cytochrome P450 CYP125 n=1 Tax=Phenylobacterium zucineum (strain HLK1) TaxID=450851 RepID=B4RF20_PHEZH|nr:cytochrome P450 [Phenylobacterium zucineum]ACG77008.1 cytochrome P450 CYP125 [Phenylobacterium zucineum HLK1]
MEIDLLSPASFAGGQPHAQFAWLREHAPVFRHAEPDGPGFWAVTRHADVRAVDRDFQTFSSEPTVMIPDPAAEAAAAFGPYKMMLMMDPPEHTAFRKLIRSEFTEPQARLRAERIRALARQIVDAVVHKGECDFVAEVAGEMPSFVIAELMGLPLDDGRELYKLTETIHTAPEALPPGAGAAAVMKMFEYGAQVMAQKRARPGDDLASRLLACEVDGRRLEDMEFLLFFLLLIDAGGDTTRNLLSGGLLALMEHPEQLAWLTADLPARLPAAREELLRYVSPVIYMRRTARRDVELGGRRIAAGDKVVMYFGAANRDPAAIERPDALDLSREETAHLAFGNGPHVCLGQHIARVEIDAMLEEVLSRMTDFAPAGEVEWLASNFISGPKVMPLRFRAAA